MLEICLPSPGQRSVHETGSEHGRDAGRIADVLPGHPGVGGLHQGPPLLAAELQTALAASGGCVHPHVGCLEAVVGRGEQRQAILLPAANGLDAGAE